MRSITMFSSPSFVGSSLLAAALLLSSTPARASGGYPGTIASELAVGAPACTLCHDNPNGGAGTATQKFALTMKSKYELTGGGATDVLVSALRANTDDSDGDGTSDIEELRNGGDPNGGGAQVDPAKYGCIEQSNTIAPSRAASPRLASMAIAALVGAVLFLRRRR